jgi:cytochrome c oxidase cbb3-type subunit 3
VRRSSPPLLALLVGLSLAGCQRAARPGDPATAASPDRGPADHVPLGAGPGEVRTGAAAIANPFESDAAAAREGKALFGAMNCVYCHGANGSGLMGPPLNGHAWRYGGSPAELYNSIHDGRPQGMPSFRQSLPPQSIWQLVAYLETLGGATAPADPAATKLLGPTSSTTGPQAAEQSQTDSAALAAAAGSARASPQSGR